MIHDTLILVGPGGIGKSPLDSIIRHDVLRIDPYRLREDGPRNRKDVHYAHPKIRDQLYLTYEKMGLSFLPLSDEVLWSEKAMTFFLRVRKEWQLLFLGGLSCQKAKAEIFAPAIPVLLSNPIIKNLFGRISMVVLNPAGTLDDLDGLRSKTDENCRKRGDTEDSVKKRVKSLDEEVPAWKQMMTLGAIEYPNWPYAEHIYSKSNDKICLLIEARSTLRKKNPRLEIFFKTNIEIKKMQL